MRFDNNLGLYISSGETPTAWEEIIPTLSSDQLALLFSFQRNPAILLDFLMDVPDGRNFYIPVGDKKDFKDLIRTILRPRDAVDALKSIVEELGAVIRVCERAYPDPSEQDIEHLLSSIIQAFPEREEDFRAVLQPHISDYFARKKAKQAQEAVGANEGGGDGGSEEIGCFVMETASIDVDLQDSIADATRALTEMACGSWDGERQFLLWVVNLFANKLSEFRLKRDYITQYILFLQDMIEAKTPHHTSPLTLFDIDIPSHYDPDSTAIRPIFKHIVQMIVASKNGNSFEKRRRVRFIIDEVMKAVEDSASHYPTPIREDVRRDTINTFLSGLYAFTKYSTDYPLLLTANCMKWGVEINAEHPLRFGDRFLGYCNKTKKVAEYVSACTGEARGTECLLSGYLADGTDAELHLVSPLTLLFRNNPQDGQRWKTRGGFLVDLIQGAGGLYGYPSIHHHVPYIGTVHPSNRDYDLVDFVGGAENPCPIPQGERKEKPDLFDRGFAFVDGRWQPAFLRGETEVPVGLKPTNETRPAYDFLTEEDTLRWNASVKKIEDGAAAWNQDEIPDVGHFGYPIFVSHKTCPTLSFEEPKKGEVWRLANGSLVQIKYDGFFPHQSIPNNDMRILDQYKSSPLHPCNPDLDFWCIDPMATASARIKKQKEDFKQDLDALENAVAAAPKEEAPTKSKKYEILHDQTMQHEGRTLYRIRRLSDGLIGGWIEKEDNLSQDGKCFVYHDAKVFGDACVFDDAEVLDNAVVCENASIFGKAAVFNFAGVVDRAKISGCARIFERATIYGNAEVFDDAHVYGNAMVSAASAVYNNAIVCGCAEVYGHAKVFGFASVFGYAKVYENAQVGGYAKVHGIARVRCNGRVFENADVAGEIVEGTISHVAEEQHPQEEPKEDGEAPKPEQQFLDELEKCLAVEQEPAAAKEPCPNFQVGDIVSRDERKYVVEFIDTKAETLGVRELESRSPCRQIFAVSTFRMDDPEVKIVLSRPIPAGYTFLGYQFTKQAINASPCDCRYYTPVGEWKPGRLFTSGGKLFILLRDVTLVRDPAWADVIVVDKVNQ